MSAQATQEAPVEVKEFTARHRFAHITARKARYVADLIRGRSVNEALELLRMARKLDRYRASARMALEPWLVEAALSRLGDRRLSREEQATVVQATRTPGRVRWPAWWEVRL